MVARVWGAHADLLRYGEVLYPSALLGLVLFPFRRMSARGLKAISADLTVLITGDAVYDAGEAVKQKAIARNRTDNTSNFAAMIRARVDILGFFHRQPLYSPILWDFVSLMLLGSALLKTGVLTPEPSTGFYCKMALASYLAGLPLRALQLYRQTSVWFSINASLWAGVYYQFARIAVCPLNFRNAVAPGLTRALAAPARWLYCALCL